MSARPAADVLAPCAPFLPATRNSDRPLEAVGLLEAVMTGERAVVGHREEACRTGAVAGECVRKWASHYSIPLSNGRPGHDWQSVGRKKSTEVGQGDELQEGALARTFHLRKSFGSGASAADVSEPDTALAAIRASVLQMIAH